MWRMPPLKVRSGMTTLDLKPIPVPMLYDLLPRDKKEDE